MERKGNEIRISHIKKGGTTKVVGAVPEYVQCQMLDDYISKNNETYAGREVATFYFRDGVARFISCPIYEDGLCRHTGIKCEHIGMRTIFDNL